MIERLIYCILFANGLLSLSFNFFCSGYPDYFIAKTSGYGYMPTGIDLQDSDGVVLEVQSPTNAHVALVSIPGQYSQQMYEIVFDTPLAITTFRTVTLSGTAASIKQAYVLQNGTVPVMLWISWANGSLAAGKGDQIGKNPLIYYPDNSRIQNLTTMAVSSYFGCNASWKIAYNQSETYENPIEDSVYNDLVYNATICQDVVFTWAPGVIHTIDLQVILVGRTSFMFQLDYYNSLISLVFYSSKDVYTLNVSKTNMLISKNGVSSSNYVIVNAKPALNASPGYYWISWINGLVTFGFGPDIGKQAMMICNVFEPIQMQNITAIVNGTISIPFRYYVGLKVLQRKSDENVLTFEQKGWDSCSTGAVLRSVGLPSTMCRSVKCALFCWNTPECTAFCMHQTNSTTHHCRCELQAKPGTPTSGYFYRYEPGTTYWELCS